MQKKSCVLGSLDEEKNKMLISELEMTARAVKKVLKLMLFVIILTLDVLDVQRWILLPFSMKRG